MASVTLTREIERVQTIIYVTAVEIYHASKSQMANMRTKNNSSLVMTNQRLIYRPTSWPTVTMLYKIENHLLFLSQLFHLLKQSISFLSHEHKTTWIPFFLAQSDSGILNHNRYIQKLEVDNLYIITKLYIITQHRFRNYKGE